MTRLEKAKTEVSVRQPAVKVTIEEEVKEQPVKESSQFWSRIFSPKVVESDDSDQESKRGKT